MSGPRGTTATAAVIGAVACAAVGILVLGAHAADPAPLTIRFVDAGRAGTAQVGLPAPIRVEIAAPERLEGTLEVRLAQLFTRANRSPERLEAGHLARVPFALEAGERRVVTASIPEVPPWSDMEVHWRVLDGGSRLVAEGREPFRGEKTAIDEPRILLLTDTEGSGVRAAPRAAFEDLSSGAEFTGVLVSGRNLTQLGASQRAALADWVTAGGVLVVTAPHPRPVAGPNSGERDGVAIWSDDAGREAREDPRHLGFVRTVDLALDEIASPSSPEHVALARLLFSRGPVLPPQGEAPRFRHELVDLRTTEGASRRHSSAGPATPSRALGAAAAVGLPLVVLLLGAAWFSSRASARVPVRPLIAVTLLAAASPALGHLVLTRVRTGNMDRCWEIVYVDGSSAMQTRWTVASIGGGGGSANPALEWSAGPRTAWTISRGISPEYGVHTDQDRAGRLRAVTDSRGLTQDRQLVATRCAVEPAEAAWDEDVTRAEGDTLRGRLRARRAFRQVILVGPTGVARFGAVRPGDSLDVDAAAWPPTLHLEPEEMLVSDVLLRLCSPGFRTRRCGTDAFYAVGLEDGPSPAFEAVGGAEAWSTESVSVQRIRLAGTTDPMQLTVGLPAERQDDRVTLLVPEVLRMALASRGLELADVRGSFALVGEPVLQPVVREGFRAITFRVSGVPGPIWSSYGPGLAEGVWRRR